jgi:DNA polymerase III subunit epsilon
MWQRFFGKESQRKRALSKAGPGPMRDYLSTPFPATGTDWKEVDIVALDLETTGLDPKKDHILSFGLIHLRHNTIRLNSAWHEIVRIDEQVPESSAVIHHITDDDTASGKPLEELLPQLLHHLAGKVILVHYKNIEQNFIDAACRRLYGMPFIIPIIDTLPIAQRLLEFRNHTIRPGNLRLFNMRALFNLPQYKAHNAMYDALATAELFLAMAAEMNPRGNYKIGDFINA